jgi:hypothetical protein
VRARAHELAGVSERIVLHVARDEPGARVDRDHAATVAAPAEVRASVFVECEIPEGHALRPAPCAADD